LPRSLAAARSLGLLVGIGLLSIGQAKSQEYCVACSDPPAVYRCIIVDAKPGGNQPLQTFCISAMTKQGRHGKCAVRGGTVFDCDGQVKRVPWNPQGEVASAPSSTGKLAPAPDPSQPPKSVEEMAQRAKEKTASDIKQANETVSEKARTLVDNIGDTTKKTWRCIASLFTRCKD
jgi:hypothetical protein